MNTQNEKAAPESAAAEKAAAEKAAAKVTYAQAVKAPADIVTMPDRLNEQVRLFNGGHRQMKGVIEQLAITADDEWKAVYAKLAKDIEKMSGEFRNLTMNHQAALVAAKNA